MHSESFSLFRCQDCGKIDRFPDFFRPESDTYTLIAVLSGEVCVHVSDQSYVLPKHTFAVW